MSFYISKIILWPKNTSLSPREIKFDLGKINIISGASSTGKSSITWIIDYCLCSSKCSIPVGLIRDVTNWYGLLLRFSDGTEMLIARREPREQQSTDDMYWQFGTNLKIPQIILDKNTNRDTVKSHFNQRYNFPHEKIDNSYSLKNIYPSFRDMAAFNFQPQHIVANPYTLFFKADTTEHREKLKVIFPLVLGVITSDTLIKQRKLKDLQNEYERKIEAYKLKKDVVKAWLTDVATYYMEAYGLGIVPDYIEDRNEWDIERYKNELIKIKDRISLNDLPIVIPGSNEKFVIELQRVIEEEDSFSQKVGELRRHLSKLTELNNSVNDYTSILDKQADRVSSIGWLSNKLGEDNVCPFCKAKHNTSLPAIRELHEISDQFASLTNGIKQTPKALESNIADISKELRINEELLSSKRKQRQRLELVSIQQTKHRQKIRDIYKFVGKLEQAIENVDNLKNIDYSELKELKRTIDLLKNELDVSVLNNKKKAAIELVSHSIHKYAGLLELEHANKNVTLDINELTVSFKTPNGKTDYLWEVGSGQNWLGYHIATLLAIHQYVANNNENFVPQFLVIDQPSQVYFPETLISNSDETDSGNKNFPTDVEGVKRIFSTISAFLDEMKSSFQIIVTEHAGDFAWEDSKHINLVEEWRNGSALIPNDWIV